MLRATLARTGLPREWIREIRAGHTNNTLRPKIQGQLGGKIKNDKGVFQGSPLSALLFIIYQNEMMEEYQELCDAQLRTQPQLKIRSEDNELKWPKHVHEQKLRFDEV